VSLVPRSREQCKRHLFRFIKPDIFPTRSSGAIPFLSISFFLLLKSATQTKAVQRSYKRLSTIYKFPYNSLFLKAVKKDEIKEECIFHFANPYLSFYAMHGFILMLRLFIPSFISIFLSPNSIAIDRREIQLHCSEIQLLV